MKLNEQFLALEEDLGDSLFERDQEIHSAILALIAKKHVFYVGVPGIAKSMLVNNLVARIAGIGEGQYFKHLLTKFTVPEELFGPPDFNLMKDEGIYKRRVEGYLPEAIIAFLDEIFKANSAILNTLLTAINEGEFHNHNDDPRIPLQCVFAASNEIPQSAELEALADRLHFWHHVQPIQDPSNFAEMISGNLPANPDTFVTLDDVTQAQREMASVHINDSIIQVILELAKALKDHNIVVSDRRFYQSMDIIRAEAWLDGRDQADIIDTKPLQHVFWRDIPQIPTVRKLVLDLADPLERDILELRENLEKVYEEFVSNVSDRGSKAGKTAAALEAYEKFTKAKEEFASLRKREKEHNRKSKHLAALRIRLKTIGKELLEAGVQNKTATKGINPNEGLDD